MRIERRGLLVQYHSFVAAAKNSPLSMPTHGTGEYHGFDVASNRRQALYISRMTHPLDPLFYDRSLVEFRGDIVGCGANDFNASIVGLLVRACPFKAGKKRMVNVDDVTAQSLAQLR